MRVNSSRHNPSQNKRTTLMLRAFRTSTQKGYSTLELLITVLVMLIAAAGAYYLINYKLNKYPGMVVPLEDAVEQDLRTFTTELEFQALSLTAALPPGDAHAVEKMSPANAVLVSNKALVGIYRACATVRDQDEHLSVRDGKGNAITHQMAQVASTCSRIAQSVSQKTFTYGQLRTMAVEQRKHFDAAVAATTPRQLLASADARGPQEGYPPIRLMADWVSTK